VPQNLNILKNGILVNNCFKFFLHELININKNLPQGQGINSSQKLANIINDKSLGKSTSVPIKNKFINSNNTPNNLNIKNK